MARKYPATTLIVTFLMLAGLLSAIPSASAEGDDSISWGIEYEWVNYYDDVQALTGLPYDDIKQDIEDSATYAGFSLELVDVLSGSTSMYVEQWEDSTVIQISDDDGDSHSVTTRMTEVTLRSGMLHDAAILMDWANKNASLDIVLSVDEELLATMDLLYTEYVTLDMKLVGADLVASSNFGLGLGSRLQVDVVGGNESFDMDIDIEYEFGWGADSLNSAWRLGEPSDVYDSMNAGYDFDWDCEENDCGSLSGSFATHSSYSILFTGLPLDEFGLEADALDLHISDILPDSGTFNEQMDFEIEYEFGDEQTVIIDDAGSAVAVKNVENFPLPPGMAPMVAFSMANAAQGSGDQTTMLDAVSAAMEEWSNDVDENLFDNDTFVCDNGEEIPDDWVNDGEEDCSDGSDEDGSASDTYQCDNGEEIPNDWVNDGEEDCTDGSDEGVEVEDEELTELERRFGAIAEAFGDSNFEKSLDAFADKLDDKLEDYADFEVQLAYVDGEFNSLWSEEESRFVGIQVLVETEAGNVYSIIGPESDIYNNNPPTTIHVRYLIGEAADEAEDSAESADTIEELAPVSEHDVTAVYDALGIDPPPGSSNQDDGGTDGALSSMVLIVGGIITFVVLLIIALFTILLMTRKRSPTQAGNIDYVDPGISQSEYGQFQQEMMQPAAQSPMPPTLPDPQVPPANQQGTLQQGHEVLEWPSGSGNWWRRDHNTGMWVVWQ